MKVTPIMSSFTGVMVEEWLYWDNATYMKEMDWENDLALLIRNLRRQRRFLGMSESPRRQCLVNMTVLLLSIKKAIEAILP
ncbi:hypothetical protein PCCS19_27550 [Paenibacillus sp. CCS19]|uniref:hypothetical protein n=1 Tax=Paenibacillus sp. CCS19 TaxID=3158387 RepID=UPI0025621E6E|nr:hypothetical protein [Paenibacillus cellulosilyticus]GMK39700.1 hypothetical protein PCCS19_27550 [Paenibacillus cellulosilyticus]